MTAPLISEHGDLEIRGLKKAFGHVVALDGADLTARFGSVHALLGQNGAGKSTLVKILAGCQHRDEGTVSVAGELLDLRSVRESLHQGIATVFQELSLIPDLSVAQNMFYEREPMTAGLIDTRSIRRLTRELLERYGIDRIEPDLPVRALSIAERQMLEIVKALSREPRVLILDEPTSSLPQADTEWLFDLIRKIKGQGIAVLFISHRLREVLQLCDSTTVFRNGKSVAEGPISAYTEGALVQAMLGRGLSLAYMEPPPEPRAEVLLEVVDLSSSQLHDVSFTLRRGEILGLGGLEGQGQVALLETLFGLRRSKGRLTFAGRRTTVGSAHDALARGITFIPRDRLAEGLMPNLSIRENFTIPLLPWLSRLGWINPRAENENSRAAAASLSLLARSVEDEVTTLSGGNQQKVLVARVLAQGVKLLLLADVTRGVDVGTKADLYEIVRRLASNGVSVIMYSTDATELISLCHRVAVMFDHRIAVVLEGEQLTEENLLRAGLVGSLSS